MTAFKRVAVFLVAALSPCWADNCTIFYERPSLKECAFVSGTPNHNNYYHFKDHITAGATTECLEQVQENSVRCYKWILGDLCQPSPSTRLFLRDRAAIIKGQDMVTATPGSVSFRSPNFHSRKKKRYFNNMLCVYNISVSNCKSGAATVRSTRDDHSLFDDGRDYLYFAFGEVTSTVRGDGVSSFSQTVPSTTFSAVLWSDSTPGTDLGLFQLHAVCNNDVVVNKP